MGVDGGQDLTDQDPQGIAHHSQPARHQHHHQYGAHTALDHQIDGQVAVAAVGLEEAAVNTQQDPHPGGHQDQDHALAVGQVELTRDPPLDRQHHPQLDGDGGQTDPVHLGDPWAHQLGFTVSLECRHPTHHAHQDRRSRHRQDEEQPEQLGDLAVGP